MAIILRSFFVFYMNSIVTINHNYNMEIFSKKSEDGLKRCVQNKVRKMCTNKELNEYLSDCPTNTNLLKSY